MKINVNFKVKGSIIMLPILLSFLTISGASAQKFPKMEGMVLIPGGTFSMGIDSSDIPELVEMGKKVPHMNTGHALWWFGDEMPRHQVKLDSFYMDVHEVTNREFKKFVEQTGYQSEGDWQKYATEDRLDHPVVNVTWNDAQAYARWAGKRLPTEEEWEYAAHGSTNFKWFPWGNEPDPSKAHYRHQGETFFDGLVRLIGLRKMNTRPVMSYPPNGYGLYDMIGNVREWTSSDYQPYPGGPAGDKRYEKKGQKVVRGGSWETPNPVFLRITSRHAKDPNSYSWNLGFRCVKDVHKNKERYEL